MAAPGTEPPPARSWLAKLVWLFGTLFFSYVFAHPYDLVSRSGFMGGSDLSALIWILDWQQSHLAAGRFGEIFTGNAFYPVEGSAIFSANFLSTAVLTLPLYLATANPYLSYHVGLFLSFPLSALGMFLLVRRLGYGDRAACLAAWIFAFSEFRLYMSSYVQLASMQWMPFCLLFLERYFDRPRRRELWWAALFFALQVTACEHYLIFFSILLLGYLGFRFQGLPRERRRQLVRHATGPCALGVTAILVNYLPYWSVAQTFDFERKIEVQIDYGASLENFLATPNSYLLGPWTHDLGKLEGNNGLRGAALLLAFIWLWGRRDLAQPTRPLPLVLRNGISCLIVMSVAFWWMRDPLTGLVTPDEAKRRLITVGVLTPGALTLGWLLGRWRLARGWVRDARAGPYFFVALIALVAALGPIVKIAEAHLAVNPLGLVLYYAFPGYSAIRAISRFGGLVPLGLAVAAAAGHREWEARLRGAGGRLLLFLFLALGLALEMFPQKGLQGPAPPRPDPLASFYDDLRELPDGPLLEWPLAGNEDGARAMERSIRHRKPIVNGAASYYWKGYSVLREKCAALNTDDARRALGAFGVRYLTVHRDESSRDFPLWARHRLHGYELIRRTSAVLLYENESARTRFVPPDYLRRLAVRTRFERGQVRLRLWLEPSDEWFVSREKRVISLRIEWPDGHPQTRTRAEVVPTLWTEGRLRTIRVPPPGGARPRAIYARDGEGPEVELPLIAED